MTKKLLMIIKITMLISVLFFASCNSSSSSSDTATPSGGDTAGDTAIGEVIGTTEGKVLLMNSGNSEIAGVHNGVTNMTCTLEVEEAGKSPITYNGACDKDTWEAVISFRDKEDDPSISARLVVPHTYYFTEEIEYSKAEDVVRDNPTATTKVSRENNVWEGKITDGGTDLLKLTITTKDKVVPAPTGSKPCQLVNKMIVFEKIDNYTLDGYCVLTYDTAGTTVTKLDFTSSLANPAVIISLPIGETDQVKAESVLDNRSLFKDAYLIGGYLYNGITLETTIDFNDNKNNTFTAKMNYDNGNGVASEFDIVLTE